MVGDTEHPEGQVRTSESGGEGIGAFNLLVGNRAEKRAHYTNLINHRTQLTGLLS